MQQSSIRLALVPALLALPFPGPASGPEPVPVGQESPPAEFAIADTVYRGGPILTLDDAAPLAEALAVLDGRILAVGSEAEVARHIASRTHVLNLEGRALLPGFVDSHGHLLGCGLQALAANLLAPPDGQVEDIASLQNELREWAEAHPDLVEAFGGIVGFGYDESQLAERRSPTRDDLDAVSSDLPVYVIHQSGHLGVANGAALARAGLSATSEDPPGGVVRRRPGSREPDGVLEEAAHFAAIAPLLSGSPELDARMVAAGQESYARFGYTTVQEGRSLPSQVAALERAASSGRLFLDVVSYPDFFAARETLESPLHGRQYTNRLRIGGAKLSLDGSPQGRTAWRDRPYYRVPDGADAAYAGYPANSPEQTSAAVVECYERGWQLLVHANGEAAIDSLLANVASAREQWGAGDRRTVLVHGQFLREDQVDRLGELEIFPSLFPMHTFYWGDWHRDVTRGPALADDISPTGWVLARGLAFGSHHDAPVALPNSMRVLDATVTRRSRSGDILGAEHRVPVWTALKAMTIWPAWQHFEEDDKGSLEVGKLADFALLSANPLDVDPEQLDTLEVLATIKQDRVVYGEL